MSGDEIQIQPMASVSMCVVFTTLERNTPDRVKRGKMLNLWPSRTPKSRKSHSKLSWHFISSYTNLRFLFCEWQALHCCHAFVNPTTFPFCHSRCRSRYSDALELCKPISDSTSKNSIFMEKFQREHVWLTGWHNTNQDGCRSVVDSWVPVPWTKTILKQMECSNNICF